MDFWLIIWHADGHEKKTGEKLFDCGSRTAAWGIFPGFEPSGNGVVFVFGGCGGCLWTEFLHIFLDRKNFAYEPGGGLSAGG